MVVSAPVGFSRREAVTLAYVNYSVTKTPRLPPGIILSTIWESGSQESRIMPAWAILKRKWLGSYRLGWSAFSLTMVLITPGPIHAGAFSNSSQAAESIKSTRYSESVIGANAGSEAVAIGSPVTLRPRLVDGTHALLPSKVLKEVGKQAIDQPGHFLIAAVPIWASRCLAGVPWFGWVAAPLLAYREWLQWPSKRWWDPPLDWTFLSLGAVVATFRHRRTHGLSERLLPLRRRIEPRLSFLLATGRRTRPAAT